VYTYETDQVALGLELLVIKLMAVSLRNKMCDIDDDDGLCDIE